MGKSKKMAGSPPPPKPAHFLSSTRDDIRNLLDDVSSEFGQAIYLARIGETHQSAKRFMTRKGGGVFEVVANAESGTFRAVYTVRFKLAVYVLHVFQKKSKSGISTPKNHVELIEQRLKAAEEHYAEWSKKDAAAAVAKALEDHEAD